MLGGGNDASLAPEDCDLEATIDAYKSLVDTAKKISDNVAIAAIPPRLKPHHALENIHALNANLATLAQEQGLEFLQNDQHFFLTDNQVNDGYLYDNIHLTVKGSNKLAQSMRLNSRSGSTFDGCNLHPNETPALTWTNRVTVPNDSADVRQSNAAKARWSETAAPNSHSEVSRDPKTHDDEIDNNYEAVFWRRAHNKTRAQGHGRTRQTTYANVAKSTTKLSASIVNFCKNCGEGNHVTNDCRHRSPIECHECNCLGHKAKFCHYYWCSGHTKWPSTQYHDSSGDNIRKFPVTNCSKNEGHNVSHLLNIETKIGHLNTRSLYPKIDEIRSIVDKNDFDIFCVSETWLHEYIKDDEIHIPGYNIYRRDRNTGAGGGVCIYVKEDIHVNLRTDLMFENIEAIWVEIRQGDTQYLVSCIYRPPSASKEYYERIVDMFESARMTDYPVISLGDLNFDYVLNETLSTNPIYYIETAYEMRQLIDQPTRVDDKTSSLLDVILTSHPELHRKSEVLKYTLSDHFLIYTHIEFKGTKSPTADHNTVKFRDMKNFDADIFAHDLMSCDILNGSQDEGEISWEQWKSAYTKICDKHAPMKILRLKKRSNPWITHDIIKLMYQRDNVHANAIQNSDPLLWQKYRELRNKVTCVIKERKNAYFSDINVLCRDDPKRTRTRTRTRTNLFHLKNIEQCIITWLCGFWREMTSIFPWQRA